MQYDLTLQSSLQPILDEKELVQWAGRPHFWLFLATGIPFLLLGVLWFCIDYFGFIRHMPAGMNGFTIPFFTLHLFPFWGSILNLIRLALAHHNTVYAFTNRRIVIRSGIWGISYKTVDFDKITNLDVTVNPLEKLVGAGSIRFDSGRMSSRGVAVYDSFSGIDEPYEVFKHIKQVSLDVKTDWDYPNKLRPTENPGYKTTYMGK